MPQSAIMCQQWLIKKVYYEGLGQKFVHLGTSWIFYPSLALPLREPHQAESPQLFN